jgi:hypothetical protein
MNADYLVRLDALMREREAWAREARDQMCTSSLGDRRLEEHVSLAEPMRTRSDLIDDLGASMMCLLMCEEIDDEIAALTPDAEATP